MSTIFSLLGRLLGSSFIAATVLLMSMFFSVAVTLSSSVAGVVSGFLGSVGVRTAYESVAMQRDTAKRSLARASTENARLKRQLTSNKALVKRVNQRVFTRTLRSTARSVSAIAVESIPVLGVAALIGTTAWEIHDGCANLNDLHELYTAFGITPDYPDYQESCISYTATIEDLKEQATGVLTVGKAESGFPAPDRVDIP